MAILKAVNVHIGKNANLKGIVNYVLQPKKTEDKLVTGYCCDVPKALEMFLETKKTFGKLSGRQYYHFVQSFPPNENITAIQAHEAAVKFAEACKKFWGFEVLIVTHLDRKHLHTHFVMNSVSFVDGHKFHITRKELADMKELQNQICIKLGYSAAPEKGFDMFGNKRTTSFADNTKTFRELKKSEEGQDNSYLKNCCEAILRSVKMATNKEQFIQLMHSQGFETDWSDTRKYVTFTDLKRKAAGESKYKIRLNKLAQYFPALRCLDTKEKLLNGIQKRRTVGVGSDNNRYIAATEHPIGSTNGRNSKAIDFNTGFEQFIADCNSENIKHTAEENTRRIARADELAQQELERKRKRIRELEEVHRRDSKAIGQSSSPSSISTAGNGYKESGYQFGGRKKTIQKPEGPDRTEIGYNSTPHISTRRKTRRH